MLDWYDLIEFYIEEEIIKDWEREPDDNEIEEMYKEYCKDYGSLQDN